MAAELFNFIAKFWNFAAYSMNLSNPRISVNFWRAIDKNVGELKKATWKTEPDKNTVSFVEDATHAANQPLHPCRPSRS